MCDVMYVRGDGIFLTVAKVLHGSEKCGCIYGNHWSTTILAGKDKLV